jgi:hypothetical protein
VEADRPANLGAAVVQPHDGFTHRGFPRARFTDKRSDGTRCNAEVDGTHGMISSIGQFVDNV